MSGHSKWSTIKHKKAKVDAARGVAFQKFSRELIVAAKMGGADPNGNFRLRTAIDRAKAAGLPNDNIKRAIEKGAGAGASDNYEELTYEGYGAGGTAIFIEAMTDNRNRTAGDIRSYFSKFGGNLGETGCVGWMFKQVGAIEFEKEDTDFDKLFEAAIEANAQDVIDEEDIYKVITAPEDFQTCVETLEKNGFKVPEDISVTGFDNYLSKNVTSTEITTVYIKPEDTASIAADLIIKKINGEPYAKGRHLVGGTTIHRQSVRQI